jgi:hypothetical protein
MNVEASDVGNRRLRRRGYEREHVKEPVTQLGGELLVVYNEEFTLAGKGAGSATRRRGRRP